MGTEPCSGSEDASVQGSARPLALPDLIAGAMPVKVDDLGGLLDGGEGESESPQMKSSSAMALGARRHRELLWGREPLAIRGPC